MNHGTRRVGGPRTDGIVRSTSRVDGARTDRKGSNAPGKRHLRDLYKECTSVGVAKHAIDACLDSPDPVGALLSALHHHPRGVGESGAAAAAAELTGGPATEIQMPAGFAPLFKRHLRCGPVKR
eukprot:SAG31_NODE_2615_length_5371_cov_89.477238_2_plen_124_part_00